MLIANFPFQKTVWAAQKTSAASASLLPLPWAWCTVTRGTCRVGAANSIKLRLRHLRPTEKGILTLCQTGYSVR